MRKGVFGHEVVEEMFESFRQLLERLCEDCEAVLEEKNLTLLSTRTEMIRKKLIRQKNRFLQDDV